MSGYADQLPGLFSHQRIDQAQERISENKLPFPYLIGSMKRWFVYIILNRRREAYTGVTYDETPDRRIAEHNGPPGPGARFTRGRGPWQLIYAETGFSNRAAAQAREHELRQNRNFKSQLKKNVG